MEYQQVPATDFEAINCLDYMQYKISVFHWLQFSQINWNLDFIGVGAAWRTANVEVGSTVVIFGLGSIGLAV